MGASRRAPVQTVHQSSELWLKHACAEVEEATRLIEARDTGGGAAPALPREPLRCATSRRSSSTSSSCRRGSTRSAPRARPRLRLRLARLPQYPPPSRRRSWDAFDALRNERGLSLLEVYTLGRENEDLYQLAEALIDWDEQVGVWRFRHVKMVARVIGADVVGTQGTPVQLLAGLIKHNMYPELWTAAHASSPSSPRRVRIVHPARGDSPGARADRRLTVLRTPLVRFNERIWLELECLQPIGRYKLRGGLSRFGPRRKPSSRKASSPRAPGTWRKEWPGRRARSASAAA